MWQKDADKLIVRDFMDRAMQYRPQIVSAITWELILQLMRRFQATHDLRVFETHPGGGQYDCLTLRARDNRASLDFNLAGQSLHIWAKGKHIERLDIIDEYLACDKPKELLDRIGHLAGLRFHEKLPPSNGPVLACGLIAAIFRQHIFEPSQLKMLMGHVDTSGYGEGPRLDKFHMFPAYANIAKYSRYFFLEKDGETLCMFDMAGRVILLNGDEIPLELEYAAHGRASISRQRR